MKLITLIRLLAECAEVHGIDCDVEMPRYDHDGLQININTEPSPRLCEEPNEHGNKVIVL